MTKGNIIVIILTFLMFFINIILNVLFITNKKEYLYLFDNNDIKIKVESVSPKGEELYEIGCLDIETKKRFFITKDWDYRNKHNLHTNKYATINTTKYSINMANNKQIYGHAVNERLFLTLSFVSLILLCAVTVTPIDFFNSFSEKYKNIEYFFAFNTIVTVIFLIVFYALL